MGNTSCIRTVKTIYGAVTSRRADNIRRGALVRSDHSKFYGQATKSMRVDALAQVGDEGRGQLR
jgi:hypothetical protein